MKFIKNTLWIATPCSLVEVRPRFGGTYRSIFKSKSNLSKKQANTRFLGAVGSACLLLLLLADILLYLLFGHEDGDGTFFRNIGGFLPK
jgi:hypothetical protein